MTKFKAFEPLLVDWIDSMHISKWRESDEAIETVSKDEDLNHKSIGFYLTESKKSFSIVQSMGIPYEKDKEARNVDAIMTIPKVAITRIKRLNNAKV